MESKSFALASMGDFVLEIKSILYSAFSSFPSSTYCPRECNRVAHVVTMIGCNCPPVDVICWDGTPTDWDALVASAQ